jgi:predicted TIM-barrel fold metal-dependent hydrolase
MPMDFFDGCLPLGRTNNGVPESPIDEKEALTLMDRFGVSKALVYHTVARDSDPELGNAALTELKSDRLHKIWAFDPTYVIPESPKEFLKRALKNNVKAILINPLMRALRIDRSLRLLELAKLLEKRRIPLLAVYRQWDAGQDVIDWYQLADFCNMFPKLPVVSWEYRSRANRPMFDALAQTKNLYVSLASIWQAQMIETISDAFGPRLIFSLGLPLLDPASFIGPVAYAPIPEKQKIAIASGNIQKILREANYE